MPKILVIEDEAPLRANIARLPQAEGYAVPIDMRLLGVHDCLEEFTRHVLTDAFAVTALQSQMYRVCRIK